MNIAIQGHPTRGKEVIQILKSLGGKNKEGLNGSKEYWYFINSDGYIRNDYKSVLQYKGFKTYTLEEFETEFPFKVGDKVITTDGTIGIIDKLKPGEDYPYCIKADVGGFYWCVTSILKSYKEMKEERNITLTLEKAKEWYQKGGELKEVALQAYSEEELNSLPRSWAEFVESTKFTFNCGLEYINGIGHWSNGCLPNKSIGESSEILGKYLALFQLEQLKNYWIQNRTYKWDDHSFKYQIKFMYNRYEVLALTCVNNFLTFPTREMAEEFLECFRDLIEKAGDLI